MINFKNPFQTAIKIQLLIAFTFVNYAFSQKVSDIQEGNLFTKSIKVDGKLDDWQMPLKASNKSTDLSYSLANDTKNLYLAINAKESSTITKIMLGGITFTLNPDGKKKSKTSYSVTYPIVNRNRRANNQGQGGRGGLVGGGGFGGQQLSREQRDSLQKAQIKTQLEASKDIKIFGFTEITDSLISIYNEYGIKAATSIGDDGTFSYEMAIPLSLLSLKVSEAKEFAYNIKVNGLQINPNAEKPTGGSGQGGGRGGQGGGGQGGGGARGGQGAPGGIADRQALLTSTDLWGKYILAIQ